MFNKNEIDIIEQKYKELNEYLGFLNNKDLSKIQEIAIYCKFYNKDFIKPFNVNHEAIEKIDMLLDGIDIYNEKTKVILKKEGLNLTFVLDEIRSSLKSNHNINEIYIDFLENSISN